MPFKIKCSENLSNEKTVHLKFFEAEVYEEDRFVRFIKVKENISRCKINERVHG